MTDVRVVIVALTHQEAHGIAREFDIRRPRVVTNRYGLHGLGKGDAVYASSAISGEMTRELIRAQEYGARVEWV